MQVTPGTTVRAGTTLEVRPIGRCAQPQGASIDLAFQLPHDRTNTFEPVYGETTRDAEGNWSGHLTIPAATPPGAYELAGYCVFSRTFTSFYPAVPITVLPSP
jgi:hypothetical protein